MSYRTLQKTKYDTSTFDNNWENKDEKLDDENKNYVTHVLYPFPEYKLREIGDLNTGTPNFNSSAREPSKNYIPLIVIHGIQSDDISNPKTLFNNPTNPKDLIKIKNSAEKYWSRFLDEYWGEFAIKNNLYDRYRIYLYKYPSYKHITYNAKILKELIEDIDDLKDRKVVILAHSMGGLVSRSLIEEHGYKNAIALITLNTPHHGSPVVMHRWIDTSAILDLYAITKLNTPGANDLFWDNYDGIFEWVQEDMASDDRIHAVKKFDEKFRKCLCSSSPECGGYGCLVPLDIKDNVYNEGFDPLHRFPNPWLTWLNERIRREKIKISTDYYYMEAIITLS